MCRLGRLVPQMLLAGFKAGELTVYSTEQACDKKYSQERKREFATVLVS